MTAGLLLAELTLPHLLGYHHAIYLAMHWGQIRSLRNLFRTTRGLPARFVPDNPTFSGTR